MIAKNYIFGRKYGTAVNPSLLDGLRHVYRFEETSGTTCFDSLLGVNGVYNGGVLLDQSSPVGRAVLFDGANDYVSFSSNLDILTFPLSITLLAYFPDFATNRIVLGGSGTVSTMRGISILNSGQNVYIRTGNGAGSSASNRKDYATTTNPLVVGWNTIVVNFNSFSNYDVYVNSNTLIPTSFVSGTATTTDFLNASYVINRYNTTYYTGRSSEIYIHDRVLTSTEIQNLVDMFNTNTGIIPAVTSLPSFAVPVHNKGVNGNNTSDVIARLTDINSVSADVAIIMIGLNDWRHPTGSKRRTPAQFETNLTTIVQDQQAQGRTVVLLNITPILFEESDYVCALYSEPTGCDSDATGDQFRTKVQDVATNESALFYDLHADFTAIGQPSYTPHSYMENALNSASTDGLHFRPNGAQFCAEKVYDYLVSQGLQNESGYVCIGDSQTFGDGLTTIQSYPYRLALLLNN